MNDLTPPHDHNHLPHPLFIAEVKTRSPFGFKSEYDWRWLLNLAIEHGDMVAVHTHPDWGGGLGQLEIAANALRKLGTGQQLLLAKGIHETDSEIRAALDHGADLVLVVGRIPPPELAPVCIWEPRTVGEFAEFAIDERPTLKIMWNERDLDTGQKRTGMDSFDCIRNCYPGWMCQASFIERQEDVSPRADAFIVGEHLPSFIYPTRLI